MDKGRKGREGGIRRGKAVKEGYREESREGRIKGGKTGDG